MLKIENYKEITNEKIYQVVTVPFSKDFPLLKVNFDVDDEMIDVDGMKFHVNDCLVSDSGEWINIVCMKVERIDTLWLASVAQAYYEGLRAPSLAQGWEKYVATDGHTCLFVHSDYTPQPGEAVFSLATRNRKTSCQLYKKTE